MVCFRRHFRRRQKMNAPRRDCGFYFALPRLWAKCRGGNAARDESNWLEMNVAGLFFHLIAYVFAFHLLASGLTFAQQILLLIPLAFLVWFFWLLLFYLDSLCIKLLRALGFMRRLSDGRAQTILIGVVMICFAISLASESGVWRAIGILGLGIFALNLLAAAILALASSNVPAAE
jgi:hypothetical protein